MNQKERDVAFMAILNKAIEMNNVSMNLFKESRYHHIGTLLYSAQQSLQDGMREVYVDAALPEVDPSEYKNATAVAKAKAQADAKAKAQAQAQTQPTTQPQQHVNGLYDNDDEEQDGEKS